MKFKNCVRLLINAVVAISLCGFVLSCGGGGDDSGSAPGKSGTIAITTDLNSIPADGSSSTIIRAVIKDSSGGPVRHYTEVVFTTTLGHFRNGSTRYTMQTQPPLGPDGFPNPDAPPTGIANVQFTAGTTAGSAKITVNSNGVTNSIYVTLKGGTGAIVLTVSPESIPADGSSATKVTATVTDALGGAVIPGTEITFKTGLGYFGNGSKTQTIKTIDDTGIVDVSLIAGVVPGTTYIQATTGDVTQALSLVMTKIDPSYSEITVEANPSRIAADGKSQSVITATVTQIRNIANVEINATGQPVSGVPITFYKITSNVEPQPLPEANTYIGTGTSIAGPFYSYGGLTTFYMTAVPSSYNEYFTVWLFNPLSGERQLLINRANWGYLDTFIEEKGVSLLPGNYQLEIQTNCYYEIKVVGDIGPAQTGKTVLGFAETDINGNAFYTYTADWLPGTFNIKAETGELSNSENALSQETTLTQTGGTPAPIEVNTASAAVYANGANNTTVTAQVWIDGNKAPDGTVVNFSATSGTIDATGVTVDGIASATLTAIASTASVVSTVTVTVGTDSGSATVTFVGVSLSDMQATPPAIFADGTDTSQITVCIRDADGTAVPGETISFVTDGGTLTAYEAVTNADGIASITLTAPTTTGTATISAKYGLVGATTTIIFSSSVPVGTITLTADPTSIPADGSSSSILTAILTDTSGAPSPKGTLVTFTTTLGTFSNGTKTIGAITPDDTGVVWVSLISGTTAGSATVTATSNSVTQAVTITFGGTVVAGITVTATPGTLPANGTSTSDIRAEVKDAQGNPITDGEVISFTITSGTGTLSAASAPTVGGFATVTYTASTIPGTVTIQAMAANFISGSTTLTLTSGGVGSITLLAEPPSIPADGSSSSVITATVTDAAGKPVPVGTTVTFSTTLGTLSSTSVPTFDDTGIVTVSLISGTTPGTASVTAQAIGVTQAIGITFTHAGNKGVPVAEAFSQASWYLNVTGLWIASLQDQITASVGDVYGNAVEDNTLIYFKTYNTGGFFDRDQDPTVGGFASSTLFTTGGPTPLQGFAFMTSETGGGPTTRVSAFGVTPYPDHHIVYAGTNGGGVYKSTDSGATWETVSRSTENQKQGQNLIDPYVKGQSAICVDPDDHNTVYVGTGYLGQGNLFRSLDGGLNWNSNNVEEWNGLFETNAAVVSVLCDGGGSDYVWLGTEGRGPLFATDGKTFQPSNGTATAPQFSGSGNGTMSQPILWYSSKSETWTSTCVVVDGSVTTPVFTGVGDGYMTAVTTSPTTQTENWTVTYKAVAGTPTFTGTGNGSVRNILLTEPNSPSETWTLRCESVGGSISAVTGTATGKGGIVQGIAIDYATHTEEETFTLTCIDTTTVGSEKFELTSSLGGWTYSDPIVGMPVNENGVQLTITATDLGTPYLVGDTYIFTYTPGVTTFSVKSNVAGFYPEATVGTTYNEDGLSLLINQGTTPFEVLDTFTFTTTSAWRVVGAVSGIQTNTAETGTVYTSDNNEVGFTIEAGGVPFEVNDQFTFSTIEGITYWNVAGTVSGMQTKRAFNDQFYISDNMEVRFTISEGATPFANNDTFTFTVTASGLGHGWNVWDMVKVPGTHGPSAVLYAGTSTGVYKSTNGAQTWSSLGMFTGDFITTLALYPTATGGGSDIIYAGTQNAGVWVSTNSGGNWTQYTGGMDSGISATIKDVLVDPTNKKLYALTYKGPIDAATGKVYVHDLNADGTMTTGNWREATSGLAGAALYALAAAQPSNPSALFVGGEGINLYKAADGLDTGAPAWGESKSGMDNRIMARMPVLFSGQSTMTVLPVFLGYDQFYFEVYIQDINGNPPIMGSTFTAITYDADATEIETIFTKTYGDSYINEGTYRDPSNPTTNNPIVTPVVNFSGAVAKVEFTFTPTCCPSDNPACKRGGETVPEPGCSGSTQVSAYAF